jgi:hypothetical protein
MLCGQNVTVTVRNKRLIIEVDLTATGEPSKTGKSVVIASTKGNKPIAEAGVMLGLNVYRSN